MAKNFGKVNNSKIEAVAKKSSESANVISVKMISNDNLIDYPRNNEDVSMTEDLELSMKENGFTDPIEVTSFGCEDGKYMILSGHRRRSAGVKVGITTFPCIIKTFNNDTDVYNYVLMANAQRDSSKDPLLFCKRYKMHEEYLKEMGFKGKVREEIAKRLGLSTQQADRYNQLNKVILTVWDMIREEKVGISSVLPMSKFTPQEQEEIVVIFNDCLEDGKRLSRETCKLLIDGYGAGKRSYKEIVEDEVTVDMKNYMNSPLVSINVEPSEAKENEPINRNDEINYDTSHREGLYEDEDKYADERLTEDDYKVIDIASRKQDKAELSDREKKLQRGKQIFDNFSKLEKLLNEHYCYENDEESLVALQSMASMIRVLLDGMNYLTNDFEKDMIEKYHSLLINIQKDLNSYIEE